MILLASLLTMAVQVFAITKNPGQVSNPKVQMLGAGSQSCGKFIQFHNSDDFSSKVAFYSWAQGYASAASAVLGKPMFGNPKESLAFVDQKIMGECMTNQKQQFSAAVDLALQKKMKMVQ